MISSENQKYIAAVGMFDGVHLGHRAVVSQVCGLGRELALTPTIFTFDHHPLYTLAPEKAPKSLSSVGLRTQRLVEAGAEEVVVLCFSDIYRLSAKDFMEWLHTRFGVDALVVGYNHRFGRGASGSIDDYRQIGLQCGVQVIPGEKFTIPGVDVNLSSSTIRKAVSEGDIRLARTLLGHAYQFSGYVVHGHNIGQSIGFPTANVVPLDTDQCLPAIGAYAAWASGGRLGRFPAMVNIGSNPTVSDDQNISIEAHIIGFDGDIYGSVISLDFIDRIRPEQKFVSIDALRAQLEIDKQNTLKILLHEKN